MFQSRWLKDTIYTLLYATLWAAMEVEIEGPHGWGAKLPTKPFFNTHFTWYHIFMNCIAIMTMLRSFDENYYNLWHKVFYTAGWFLYEDVLWFLLNPDFGIEKFNQKDIWWHGREKWFLGQPIHNFIAVFVLWLSAWKSGDKKLTNSLNVMQTGMGLIFLLKPKLF